jgi:hypothetical protein
MKSPIEEQLSYLKKTSSKLNSRALDTPSEEVSHTIPPPFQKSSTTTDHIQPQKEVSRIEEGQHPTIYRAAS